MGADLQSMTVDREAAIREDGRQIRCHTLHLDHRRGEVIHFRWNWYSLLSANHNSNAHDSDTLRMRMSNSLISSLGPRRQRGEAVVIALGPMERGRSRGIMDVIAPSGTAAAFVDFHQTREGCMRRSPSERRELGPKFTATPLSGFSGKVDVKEVAFTMVAGRAEQREPRGCASP